MKPLVYDTANWLDFLRKTDEELLRLCRMDVFKATGRGGQKKNKTSNAIRLTFYHLTATESGTRSKTENIQRAVKKLRLAIALDTEGAERNRTSLTILPEEIKPFLKTSEIHISTKNPVFPIFLGFLINCYFKHRGSWILMAEDLGFTPSQIRRFFEKTTKLKRLLAELKSVRNATADRV
jgi:hypothetical protein